MRSNICVLSDEQIDMISGAGVDWGEVGAGLGAIALGVGVAGTPVGWVGAAGAALASFYGGVAVGDGLQGGFIANQLS
ncbi:hypothetical protein AB4851_04505 [Burkholderia sp. 22PA0099]|uniref:hypothetical protein n=1 Tax=Burkholderia sp. 22PA0099 TaxID=3237372 RepID=UPI0039C0BFF1